MIKSKLLNEKSNFFIGILKGVVNITIFIVCAFAALFSIPILEGKNTGEEMCVYTTEELANWHFMGMPCKLTDQSIIIFIVGYLFTFAFLFLSLRGVVFIFGKIISLLAKCCTLKKIKKSA